MSDLMKKRNRIVGTTASDNQIDGYETPDGFMLRLYHSPFQVWVYWPDTCGKVTFYFDTLDDARAAYEALKKALPENKPE